MWAVHHPEGAQGVDFRPHLWDDASKSFCLVDTGSQVTVWPVEPGDQVDPNLRLKAVNGSKIECFGYKDIEIKIGRKDYGFRAIKAKIDTPVIGWDFLRKHRLSLAWNEFGDISINDVKANISKLLNFKSLPVEESLGTKRLSLINDLSVKGAVGQDAQELLAQVAAVEALAPQESVVDVPPQFRSLLNKYPDITKENFNANEAKNGILHKINLKPDATPFRAKVRKLLPGSPKEILAKKAWFQLLDMGIIERVQKDKSNTLSSPVHFVPKPDGSLRPTGDFRALNSRTELDVFPLPHLRDFTHLI